MTHRSSAIGPRMAGWLEMLVLTHHPRRWWALWMAAQAANARPRWASQRGAAAGRTDGFKRLPLWPPAGAITGV